jgi:two-component system chemotaxis response regulator CheB
VTTHTADPVRVVVVEDSLTRRAYVVRTLEADGDITVVGQATCASDAVRLVSQLRPHVVSLDLQLPGSDSQLAVESIMRGTPTPILVLSDRAAAAGTGPAVEALLAGALEVMPSPERWTPRHEADVRRRVRAMRGMVIRQRKELTPSRPPDHGPAIPLGEPVVAIAASTGGPHALAQIVAGLGGIRAPVLLVQHIHADFVDSLTEWMHRTAAIPVRVAEHGQRLEAGVAYVGPGGVHLKIDSSRRVLLDPQPHTLHRPSADELFLSLARHAGRAGVGVVLTGMGDDGVKGLLALRHAGGMTIAQDRETSAVFGMPNAAHLAGAIAQVLPVDQIAAAVLAATRRGRR